MVKNNIGISLIVMLVTVIVIIIISSTVILILDDNNIIINAHKSKLITDISVFNEELHIYCLNKYIDGDDFDKNLINAKNITKPIDNFIPITDVLPSLKDNYYLSRISIINGKFVFSNFMENEKKWIDEYFIETSNENIENENDKENIYVQQNVNPPISPTKDNLYSTYISTGINPVSFNNDGTYTIVIDLKQPWYNYESQTTDTSNNGTSKWANIATKDGSLWVWIPRFAYKITKGAHIKKNWKDYNGLEANESGLIDIKFLKNNTNEFWDGTGYAQTDQSKITYSENGVQSDYLVSPGFSYGDIQKTGFWISKYEISSKEGNGNSLEKDNIVNIKQLQSKPNVSSWRYIEFQNMMSNCLLMGAERYNIYGIMKNTNTHLVKNTEWASIAYLAHSQYGRNGTTILANKSEKFITGFGGPLTSTTGNYYGVFDMAGCANDAVAAVLNDNLAIFNKVTSPNVNKYVNFYPVYNNNTKGDGIYETSLKASTQSSWNSDLSWFVNESEPFMSRGGTYNTSSYVDGDGIFAFNRYRAIWYQLQSVSFRCTITP